MHIADETNVKNVVSANFLLCLSKYSFYIFKQWLRARKNLATLIQLYEDVNNVQCSTDQTYKFDFEITTLFF